MALLTVATALTTGVSTALTAVSASDTISGTDVGVRGLIYEVSNAGGTQDNVVISDSGLTPAGNAGTPVTVAIPITTGRKRIYIGPGNVNPATNLVTITHSFTTSVTAEAYRF